MDESEILRNDAELVRKLICCVWDGAEPDDLDLSLYSALELYAKLRVRAARAGEFLYLSDGSKIPTAAITGELHAE